MLWKEYSAVRMYDQHENGTTNKKERYALSHVYCDRSEQDLLKTILYYVPIFPGLSVFPPAYKSF